MWPLRSLCVRGLSQKLARCAGPGGTLLKSAMVRTYVMTHQSRPWLCCCAKSLYQRLARRAGPLPDAAPVHSGTACSLCLPGCVGNKCCRPTWHCCHTTHVCDSVVSLRPELLFHPGQYTIRAPPAVTLSMLQSADGDASGEEGPSCQPPESGVSFARIASMGFAATGPSLGPAAAGSAGEAALFF